MKGRTLKIIALFLVVILGIPILIVYTDGCITRGFIHWYDYINLIGVWMLLIFLLFGLSIGIFAKIKKKGCEGR